MHITCVCVVVIASGAHHMWSASGAHHVCVVVVIASGAHHMWSASGVHHMCVCGHIQIYLLICGIN